MGIAVILRLGPGAKVGLAVQSGRLIVEPQRRPRYTLDELLAQCDPRAPRSKQERNGSMTSLPAASCSSETRRYLADQARPHGGTRAEGAASGPDRFAGGVQPPNESARGSTDHKRGELRADGRLLPCR